MSQLLDPAFLRRLDALKRQLASKVRSGSIGEGVAPRRGNSSEFREHRPYVDGDDPRRIDWNASARLGSPMLKLFQADEDRIIRLLVDSSASLGFGSPSKLEIAQRLAAALAYLALANSERAQVFVARSDGETQASSTGGARRGRAGFASICRELERSEARGPLDLARAVDAVVARAARPGVLVTLSDFLDSSPYSTSLARARAAGHDLILIQILNPEELSPALDGDYTLEDSETGVTLSVTADSDTISAYLTRLEEQHQTLKQLARRQRGTYVRCSTEQDLEITVREILG
ncbi:MAG TPA: DUF58 domain-containing protein [Polyangiales bacterium]|nr:DUF58 domain-containing protein [Polyangiales bacterium]